MANFNPFNNNAEDTSFEQGMPVSQAAKNVTKAAQQKTDDAIKKANQEIVAQLYRSSDASTQDQNSDTTANKTGSYIDTTTGMQAGLSTDSNSNQTPEEQAQIAKVRSALFGNYSGKFQSAPNGAHGLITNIDQEMERARKEREQRETQRKQEEEEEERRRQEEEEAQKQELAMPAGKKTGAMFGKKQQQPMVVQRAKTTTEINRGTSG